MKPENRRPLLIVNADDLGRTAGINRGIFAAHREGIVTSATLMVGFEAARAAAADLADHPDLGVGLHLTLSGASPTLPPDRLPHLVDEDGLLPRRPERATGPLAAQVVPPMIGKLEGGLPGSAGSGTEGPGASETGGSGESGVFSREERSRTPGERPGSGRTATGRAATEEGMETAGGSVAAETKARTGGVEGVEGGPGSREGRVPVKVGGTAAVGPAPGTGAALDRHEEDGEEWREARATLAEVLAEARHQLELFRRLVGRLPTHLDTHHHSHRILPLVLEAVVTLAREHGLPVRNASPAVARRLREEGIPTTGRFVESFYGKRTGVDDLVALLRDPGGISTEVMCHPARVDESLAAASTYTGERERELATLTDPAVRRAVDDLGWRLGHFGDLAEESRRGIRPRGESRSESAGRPETEVRR